jgi:hypothetical protein
MGIIIIIWCISEGIISTNKFKGIVEIRIGLWILV